jgi:hypothetical protein
MTEISIETRIRLIKQLGDAINYEHGANLTEPIVYELVLLLDPNDKIKDDERYLKFIMGKGIH